MSNGRISRSSTCFYVQVIKLENSEGHGSSMIIPHLFDSRKYMAAFHHQIWVRCSNLLEGKHIPSNPPGERDSRDSSIPAGNCILLIHHASRIVRHWQRCDPPWMTITVCVPFPMQNPTNLGHDSDRSVPLGNGRTSSSSLLLASSVSEQRSIPRSPVPVEGTS
jgi:hypothetical protein